MNEACELAEALREAKSLIEPEQITKAIFADVGRNGKFDNPENRAKIIRLQAAIEDALA